MYKILSLLLTVGMLGSMAPLAEAGDAAFQWVANGEPDLAGYRLYYGNSPRAQATYSQTVPINDKYETSRELTLPDGVYYFALTAFDWAGNESGFSNEVMAEISEAPPEAPPPAPPSPAPPVQPGRPILFLQ